MQSTRDKCLFQDQLTMELSLKITLRGHEVLVQRCFALDLPRKMIFKQVIS